MKIETYLNAMVLSRIFAKPREISTRQYHTFRDRIIRVDERNNMFIATLGATVERQKVRIAELEAEIDIRDKALDDSQVDLEMWRE